MKTSELIKEISLLPLEKKIYIIEKVLKSIREKEEYEHMQYAAEQLSEYYKTDKELTSFSDIDLDEFYETK